MKTLIDHINEALKIGKNISSFSTYSCQPKTKAELFRIIRDRISEEGPNCDLNDIDTSLITNMSWLFNESKFNGNISNWDTSNVNDMCGMFKGSKFTGDISKWDVSNVTNMCDMFNKSWFNNDISNWDVSNVKYMRWMFAYSKFNQDISEWKLRQDCDVDDMFTKCPIKEEFKPKALQK